MSSFDVRDIRPMMDVYTLDNTYLGTVLEIVPGPPRLNDKQTAGSAQEGSDVSGEVLGPIPTQPIGNPGPENQSAANRYAVKPDTAQSIGRGRIIVGKWGGLVGRRTIPLDAVQTVSLERVVLRDVPA